ncbi:MAG TPA: GNAT family N-acetyltransferase [Caulobacteraceae bacterium]|jgi:RimJ/RimL family protein N-acetyltransferase|nr:GNAT family N-acetyltransferase [Caulobacteraceae bacterium]
MCSALILPAIKSPRLTLRAPRISDARAIARLCDDYAIPSMTTRMPWPYRGADAEAFVEMIGDQDPDQENAFLMEHEGEVIGCIGLYMRGRYPEIGYWVGRPFWGRGFATEATRAALKWAREDWKKKVVVAGHFADNPASGVVLSKAGFLYTGEVELRHSLARGEAVPTRMMVWIA